MSDEIKVENNVTESSAAENGVDETGATEQSVAESSVTADASVPAKKATRKAGKAKAPKEPKAPKEKKPKPPKEKKPPKPKKPKASEMSLEELCETELLHSKITVSEEQKEEYAPILGYIAQRFTSRRELQDAGLEIAIMYFMETEKGKGIIQHVEGQITMFNSTTQVIGIDDNKYKLNCTYTIEPLNFDPFSEDGGFESEEDEGEEDGDGNDGDDSGDGDGDDNDRTHRRSYDSRSSGAPFHTVVDDEGIVHRLTKAQWEEMQRIQESMRRQMEYDMRRMQEKQRMRAEADQRRRDDALYYPDEDSKYYADDDSGYVADDARVSRKSDGDNGGGKKSKKSSTKGYGWLPPEKRYLMDRGAKTKKSKKSEKGKKGENSSDDDSGGDED